MTGGRARGSPPIWIDGRFVASGEPAVAADDAGFLLGLGAFETLALRRGVALFRERHLERLEESARAVGIPWPPPLDPGAAIDAWRAESGVAEGGLRVTLTRGAPDRGPTLVVAWRPAETPPAGGVTLAIDPDPVDGRDPFSRHKTTSRAGYALRREAARRRGAWDAILSSADGELLEATIANLVIVEGTRATTPDPETGCLAGITRAILVEALEAGEIEVGGRRLEARVGPIDRDRLRGADEVVLTASVSRILPARAILDLRADLPGSEGPAARAFAEALDRAESRYLAGELR